MESNNWKERKDEIILYIEKHQPVYYWDYNDELSDEQINNLISSDEGLFNVSNEIIDGNLDYEYDLHKELIKQIIERFNFNDALEYDEEFEDFCSDNICIDINIDRLIDNTRNIIVFYETGIQIGGYGQTEKERLNELKQIKKYLKIKLSDKTHDEVLIDMLDCASYGGQFVIYFKVDIKELIDNKSNSIQFKNTVTIAIIDINNGSGGHCTVNNVEFTVPFHKEKIFFENSIKYNYTFAVCGMDSDWCEDTQFEFINKRHIKTTKDTKHCSIGNTIRIDAEYNKVFKSGKCSFGDMDMKRHQKVVYINEYPCGNRCLDCGTFWVD